MKLLISQGSTQEKKSLESKQERFELYEALSRMQSEYIKGDCDANMSERMRQVEQEIKSFEVMDVKKLAFRCKMNWTQYGEVSSKYYFNLEKRNFVNKTMYVTRKHDGSLTKDYSKILNVQYEYYRELYKSDQNIEFTLQNNSHVHLKPEDKLLFEEIISKDELFDAMMTLKRDKTPGGDGITIKFMHKFWKDIVDSFYNNYLDALTQGKMNPSGKRGIINLIPKPNKDLTWVNQWRPIVLLNYDYKIWAKAIANRLEIVSSYLIGKQQNGFIKNLSIFTNLRTTAEIVAHCKRTNQPGLVVLIDFKKCFDRVEFESIRGAFHYFGFGENFLRMLFLLYNNFELSTMSNGYSSKILDKKRGTNQGCPASP